MCQDVFNRLGMCSRQDNRWRKQMVASMSDRDISSLDEKIGLLSASLVAAQNRLVWHPQREHEALTRLLIDGWRVELLRFECCAAYLFYDRYPSTQSAGLLAEEIQQRWQEFSKYADGRTALLDFALGGRSCVD